MQRSFLPAAAAASLFFAADAATQAPSTPPAGSHTAARPATPAEAKLHPHLRALLHAAEPDARLPVYFVLGDRLGYDHWFPRVFRLPLAERRATVLRELQEHAARTQRDLLDYLAAEQRAGNATKVRGNWLGNFVLAEATPLAILTAASDPSVAEVWFDHVPPRDAVEDRDAGSERATLPHAAAPPRPAAGARIPGNGPAAVLADRVWAFGIEGQGVLVLNTDSGLDTSPGFHADLAANVWTNPGEIPGNNLDDDQNGFVDDVHGWNFDANNNALDDGGGHGSQTAGCLVANGTCNGTTYGMAPLATLMTGVLGSESSQWAALQYGLLMGADVQTSSHSYKAYFNPPPNYRMHRDVGVNTLAAGLVRTNSTSNDGAQCNSTTNAARKPCNISAPGNLPPPYLDPNQIQRGQLGGVLGVGAWLPANNALAGYSPCWPFAWSLGDVLANVPAYPAANWDTLNHDDYPYAGGASQGLLKPDISAPTATRTTSSSPCSFATFSGTSNATPNACGVIALWKCANPSLTPEDVAMIVHQTASDRGAVPGKENDWGAGVIDAEAGVLRALCVHRVDGQPQWTVEHSVASGPVPLALDGVPNSLGALVLGLSRATIPLGPVVLGVGAPVVTLAIGLTDAQGDLVVNLPVGAGFTGLSLYSQAFVQDLTYSNRILASNVVATLLVP